MTALLQAGLAAAAEHSAEAVLQAAAEGLAARRGPLPPALRLGPTLTSPALARVRAAAETAEIEALGALREALLSRGRRRRHGSHYTPPELAAELVQHTLAPLLVDRPTETIRVCDPALGGGVFLLAACRHLAARLERPDALARIAANGLYGTDVDSLAVAVAQLSLWLLTGATAGLDHLAVGDALVGRLGDEPGPLVWPASPFHWRERFPAVGDGFDALVGNPPFLGGSFISGAWGPEYRQHLVEQVAGGERGNADLCAYFFRRAWALLRPGGCAGLLATNTIAEGATREVGLAALTREGARIYRAERQRRWPGEATLCVSLVWFQKDREEAPAVLDGRPVAQIGPRLTADRGRPPRRLEANRGRVFNGTKIYGQGFLLTAAEVAELREVEPRLDEVVRPYLSGDDLYGRVDRAPSREVICFRDWPLARAAQYPALLARVRARVEPERERLRGRNPIGNRRAARWWQFGSYAPRLYEAIAGQERVIAKVLHSHTHAFCLTGADAIFSHGLCVFADDDPALLAVLHSRPHELWARAQGSSLGDAPRYTISKTFETFPLPPLTAELAALGRALERLRDGLQERSQEGLTQLDRRFHDPTETAPEIREWRELYDAIDATVAAGYGWPPKLVAPAWGQAGDAPRLGLANEGEVLARLLSANGG